MLEGGLIMLAVVLDKSCSSEKMTFKQIPVPTVKLGWVLIKVKAFGLNHSEVLLRQFEVDQDYINKPIVPGIECVGEIADPSNSNFKVGDRVIALMGGMGRSFNGSYSEYALLPIKNVFKVKSQLAYKKLAAIPETFFTAYGALFECLKIKADETLLIRGATNALGIAAIQLAKANNCQVIASIRNKNKIDCLKKCGVDKFVLENEDFETFIKQDYPSGVDKVLELIGPKTLLQSMRITKKYGIVCQVGILGGKYVLNNFDPIKEIPNSVYLTSFYSNFPTKEVIDEMFSFLETKNIQPIIGKVYPFNKIKEAHYDLENHLVTGKSVVIVAK